jgi:glycosyltransferase involved in cell wall biosynthesis
VLVRAGDLRQILRAFLTAAGMLRQRHRFRAAVVASDRTGNLFALLQSLLCSRRLPTVMIDCLWYLPHSPVIRRLKALQLQVESRSVSRFVVWAAHEMETYSRAFGIPEHKFVFMPFHTTLVGYDYKVSAGDYIFSGGNGDRDYATLARAVGDLGVRTIVATTNRAAFKGVPIPGNVRVLSCDHAEFRRLMAGARVVVVPMEAGLLHSGGQQTYLNAMAMGKPVILCDSRGAPGYIEHGVDGIVIPSGDADQLRRALQTVLAQPDLAAAMGRRAKQCIERGGYSTDDCMRAIAELARRCACDGAPRAPTAGQPGRSPALSGLAVRCREQR